MLRLVGTKTSERILFHSWEGLQFKRREAKIELRRSISAWMFEDISLALEKSFKLNNILSSGVNVLGEGKKFYEDR